VLPTNFASLFASRRMASKSMSSTARLLLRAGSLPFRRPPRSRVAGAAARRLVPGDDGTALARRAGGGAAARRLCDLAVLDSLYFGPVFKSPALRHGSLPFRRPPGFEGGGLHFQDEGNSSRHFRMIRFTIPNHLRRFPQPVGAGLAERGGHGTRKPLNVVLSPSGVLAGAFSLRIGEDIPDQSERFVAHVRSRFTAAHGGWCVAGEGVQGVIPSGARILRFAQFLPA
jgi:hypothetical protein